MSDWLVAVGSALWLGVLTSISPCPLATNIAAISFVGRRLGRTSLVLGSGVLYTLGRVVAYTLLGVIITTSILSASEVSRWLQTYMNKLLGPLLILVGMFLLELITVRIPGVAPGARMQHRVERWGIWGAVPLGFIFALSFCPVSAGLFFGSLIPLAVRMNSAVALPSIYGIGTALPVLVAAVAVAAGTQAVTGLFEKVTRVEWWARRITGVLFIVVGIYLCGRYIFEIW